MLTVKRVDQSTYVVKRNRQTPVGILSCVPLASEGNEVEWVFKPSPVAGMIYDWELKVLWMLCVQGPEERDYE